MEISRLNKVDEWCWRVEPEDGMRVPAIIYADQALLADMDDEVFEQLTNVARLHRIAEVSEKAGLAARVAHLKPLVCIKG